VDRIFRYSILMAIPDVRRGERVNIGTAIYRPEGVDIRLPEAAKLRSISLGAWNAYAADFCRRLSEAYDPAEDAVAFAARFSLMEPVVRLSEPGWFIANTAEAYEIHVRGILADLVVRGRDQEVEEDEPRKKPSKINREIANEFRKIKLLASKDETIDDLKVKENHFVSVKENLRADFAFKNGVVHVTATLDLRGEFVHIKEAAWKAMVLVESLENFGSKTQRLAVYAAAPGAPGFESHLALLKKNSDRQFNWYNPRENLAYRNLVVHALRSGHTTGPTPLGL
jgi:hypothetical protein